MTRDTLWEVLERIGVSEQTLQIVTDINGFSVETLNDILYSYTGYRDVEQLQMDNYFYSQIADLI